MQVLAHSDSAPSYQLPERPLVTIAAGGGRGTLDLRDLWAYRELLYFLIWRDVKVRYKQTALGVAWAVIQPLSTMLIFSLFFGKLAAMPSDGIPYPLFAYAGLLPWTFFANAVGNSGNSLVGSSNLITKVYFPRIVIPAASVGAALVDLGVAFVVLIGLMVYYGIQVSSGLLLLPLLVGLTSLLAMGTGMWLSAVNVRYRDVRYAMPFLIQVWMFVTPIIYPVSLVPRTWSWLMYLNPLAGIIEGCRSALFGHEVNWPALAASTLITVPLVIYSAYSFRRMERTFADVV